MAATVLVVEDHDSVRIAIGRFLKAGGFTVLEAATPDAAKGIWREQADSIALLVVDVALQASSGPQLVEELFSQREAAPVIFVTAGDVNQSREATRNFPNPTILQKPFTAEALVKTVRDKLAEPRALAGFTTFFTRSTKNA